VSRHPYLTTLVAGLATLTSPALAPAWGQTAPQAEAPSPAPPPPPPPAAPASPTAAPPPPPPPTTPVESAAPAPTPAAAESTEEFSSLSLGVLLNPAITTASRRLEKATEAPATVYVISAKDIHDRGYSTLMDVLKDVPGMETVEYYYSEQGSLVPVRGVVGNNKIVLLINGMRVNPPGGEELMIRNDVSVRFADQIEIVYGPGSTLYGQDAISAVINIRTKRPGDQNVELVGGYGLYNAVDAFGSFRASIAEDTSVPLSVSGYVSLRRSDLSNFRTQFPEWWQKYQDYLTPQGRSIDPTRGDIGFNAFARIESKTASLQAWYRESARSSAEGSGEGGKSPVLWFVPESKWRDRALVVEGQHALKLANSLNLSSILTFNRYEADEHSRYVFPNGMGGFFLRDFKYALGHSASVEEKLDWDVAENTHVVFGAAANNYDIIPKATVLDGADPDKDIITQAGTLTYYTRPNDPTSRVDLNRTVNINYRTFGFYGEGEHRFADNLRAIAGVRVDLNTRYSEVPISPRAAIIFNTLNQRLTAKYIFSMAYVAPPLYYSYNVFDNGVQISGGNLDLKPERALSNEVNLIWQDRGLLLSLSGYFNHQSDLLITAQSEAPETIVQNPVFVNPDGTGMRRLAHSINLGTSNALGFDLSGRYNLGPVAAWASYSFVDFHRTVGAAKSGLAQVSHHNARVGFTWEVIRHLSLTPSLVFRSTPANLPAATYADLGVSLKNPYEVNFHAVYTAFKNLDIFLTARNVTNNKYALRGVSGPALQEPFWALLGLRFQY
jgi:outer membrane receptor for ferrienterochelin and colicin